MSDTQDTTDTESTDPEADQQLRPPAEVKYAEELAHLEEVDDGDRPFSWRLSPEAIRTFVLGPGPADDYDREIEQKWYGDPSYVERSIVTLASNRALLLIGEPGTGKSWLAELLAAAISGDSTNVVQGTAGTTEEEITYSWNIAMVIAEGQSRESMIPSPIMTSMQRGSIARFEELTRCTPDVQDSLISILSEKYISIPELGEDSVVHAEPGFNVIATANTRDQGVNDLSAALKRRFNFVTIPVLSNDAVEREIITYRTDELLSRNDFEVDVPPALIDVLIQTFEDLREANRAAPEDDRLETALTTAEQIGVLEDALLRSQFFGDAELSPETLGESLVTSLVRRTPEDVTTLNEVWHSTVDERAEERDDEVWEAFVDGGRRALRGLE